MNQATPNNTDQTSMPLLGAGVAQRRWMPAFRYLMQIGWKRFFLLVLLGMVASGLFGEVLQATGVFPQNDVVIMLFVIFSMVMTVARVILRENPEYMPADHEVAKPLVDVPAPQGQLAYAGWLLARMSWLSFAGLCLVILIFGSFLASLAKPKVVEVTHDNRPVKVIVRDSSQKASGTSSNKDNKAAEILIDEQGVHLSRLKTLPTPPVPAVPPVPPVPAIAPNAKGSPTPPSPPTASEDAKPIISITKDGVRITNNQSGQKKTVTIDSKGVHVERESQDSNEKSSSLNSKNAGKDAARNENDGSAAVADVKNKDAAALSEAEDKLRAAERAVRDAESNAQDASSIKRDVEEALKNVSEAKLQAAAAKADAEAAKADAEAAKAEAEAEKALEEAVDAQVVTIDLGKGDASAVAKSVRDALTKARGTIEQDVRDSIEQEQSQGFQLPWNKVIKALTIASVLMLWGLKIVSNSQYAARASAILATHRADGEKLKRQLSDAQLKAMQAQVEPHFLFNTLASVDYLIETAPAQASKMQKSLISYLRAALPQMRQASTTLGREAKLITSYLDIMKVRMEERLESQVNVPESLYGAEFPPMMLQSLVENSIKHGLEPKPEGGSLKVVATQQGDRLIIEVSDTGVGLAEKGAAPTAGTGIGIANIRERLQMLYGNRASFTLSPNIINGVANGTIARVDLPYEVTAQAT